VLKPFYDFIKDVRERGLEYTSGRLYAKYQGTVTSNADPQETARVEVKCRYATGRDTPLSLPAYPSTPYGGKDKGFYFPPDEGDPVWVWFDLGKPDQPRYSGSWWCNPDQARKPATSHVPAEFRGEGGSPTKRGIKWKRGHVLLGDEAADTAKVSLSTGEQKEEGAVAEKHHELLMDDTSGSEQIVVSSFGGHKTSWVDIAGQEKIEHLSKAGHFVRIDDVNESITLETKNGYKIVIDQLTQSITAETPGQQQIEMTDAPPGIVVSDATQNKVTLNALGVKVETPLLVDVQAGANVNVEAGGAATVKTVGAATVQAGGALTLSGATMAAASAGVGSAEIAGLQTDQFKGGLTQTVIGLWNVTSTIISLISNAISLGLPGTKFALIDVRFLPFYTAHTHIVTVPGAGIPTATTPPVGTPPTAITVATQNVVAN
jgi:hypothetical protein